MQEQLIENNNKHFISHFQIEPDALYLAPGRINIIGEHIDYNDGFVLPAAIDKYVCFSIRKSSNNKIEIVALDMNDNYSLNIDDELIPINKMWMNYLLGVLSEFKKRNIILPSFQLAFSSTIPMGAGLSSSAALECGFAFALNDLFDLKLSKKDIALIGQQSEHNFAGVKCGIMDQFASVFGKKDKVIKLDCNTLDYEYYDADLGDYGLLLFDTCVKHTHLTSGYNDRRNEVEEGIRIIKQHFPEVKNFRDCSADMIEQLKYKLGEPIYKRCHFVVAEISRVAIAANALNNKAYELLGKIMTATHKGLSEEYEVSCAESDFIVVAALNQKYVAGARMMGGGFGGCCLILLKSDSKESLIQLMTEKYKSTFEIDVKYYDVKIGDGISKM
jgi:galactokinase